MHLQLRQSHNCLHVNVVHYYYFAVPLQPQRRELPSPIRQDLLALSLTLQPHLPRPASYPEANLGSTATMSSWRRPYPGTTPAGSTQSGSARFLRGNMKSSVNWASDPYQRPGSVGISCAHPAPARWPKAFANNPHPGPTSSYVTHKVYMTGHRPAANETKC